MNPTGVQRRNLHLKPLGLGGEDVNLSSSAESLRSLRLLLLRATPEAVSLCCNQLVEFMRFNRPAGYLEILSARPATCRTQTRPAPAQRRAAPALSPRTTPRS